jgi:hypothetical protein
VIVVPAFRITVAADDVRAECQPGPQRNALEHVTGVGGDGTRRDFTIGRFRDKVPELVEELEIPVPTARFAKEGAPSVCRSSRPIVSAKTACSFKYPM